MFLTMLDRSCKVNNVNKTKKNEHAVALGRLGGKKGGVARTMSMTPAERTALARKAALARWHGTRPRSPTKIT